MKCSWLRRQHNNILCTWPTPRYAIQHAITEHLLCISHLVKFTVQSFFFKQSSQAVPLNLTAQKRQMQQRRKLCWDFLLHWREQGIMDQHQCWVIRMMSGPEDSIRWRSHKIDLKINPLTPWDYFYFLLTMSPLNQTLRSQEYRKWSPTKEALDC